MKKLFYIFLLIRLCVSCSEDLGNYDYDLIAPVTISAFDNEKYFAMINEEVTVEPVFNLPEGTTEEDYTFHWILKSTEPINPWIDTVGTTPILTFAPDCPAGSYIIELNVRDKKQDIMYSKYAYFNVTGSMSGWVFMEKEGDYAEVSMYGENSEGDFVYVPDILTNSGVDKELCKNPRKIVEVWAAGLSTGYGLWVLTDACTFYLDYDTGLKFKPSQKISNSMSVMEKENYAVKNITRLGLFVQDIAAVTDNGALMYTKGSGIPFFGDYQTKTMMGQEVNLYSEVLAWNIMPSNYLVYDQNTKFYCSLSTMGMPMMMPLMALSSCGEMIHMQALDNSRGVGLTLQDNTFKQVLFSNLNNLYSATTTTFTASNLKSTSLVQYHPQTLALYYSNRDNVLYTHRNNKEEVCVFSDGKFEGTITAIQTINFRGSDYVGFKPYIAIATQLSDGSGRVYFVKPEETGFAQKLSIVDQVNTKAPVISIQYHEKI